MGKIISGEILPLLTIAIFPDLVFFRKLWTSVTKNVYSKKICRHLWRRISHHQKCKMDLSQFSSFTFFQFFDLPDDFDGADALFGKNDF